MEAHWEQNAKHDVCLGAVLKVKLQHSRITLIADVTRRIFRI